MVAAALVLAAGLAGCAGAPLDLPDDPVARAATCSAVRTLELRSGRTDERPVSFAGSTEILHFAMIYAAEEAVEADQRRLTAVSARVPDVLRDLDGKNWASLVEPCNAAYPETQRNAAALPGDPFEAGMTCFALTDFLSRSAADHPAEQRSLAGLAERALSAAQPELRNRAHDNDEAHRIATGYAARAFKAGRPSSLIAQCRRRFPPPV